ncbi:MAG: heavy metal translocating P-type ATPase metal-binding domain-containing protein [Puniceicoccaceae bacterium]
MSLPQRKPCIHCGTPFTARSVEEQFCCNGCAYVHRMLSEEGFEQFYQLKSGVIQPVGSRAFAEPDWDRLEPIVQAAISQASEEGTAVARARFQIEGISCIGCVWLIERLFYRKPGSVRINIDAQTAVLTLHWKSAIFHPSEFISELRGYGYLLAPVHSIRVGESHRLVTRIGLTGAFALNTMLFTLPGYLGLEEDFPLARIFSMVAFASATLSLLFGGSYFIARAWHAIQDRLLHSDVPIALGISLAWFGSVIGWLIDESSLQFFDFVSIFTFLMLVGRWAQESALERNFQHLHEEDQENRTIKVRASLMDPEETPRSTAELKSGDLICPQQHELIPVESVLRSGEIDCSLESINGESMPRSYQAGDRLPAGARVIRSQQAVAECLEPWEASILRELTAPPTNSTVGSLFIDRLIRPYTFTVLVLAALAGILWTVLDSWVAGGAAAISILVVSCPCALGISLPLVGQLALHRLRREGLFVRQIDLFARLKAVRRVVFDKTGTLTFERIHLLDTAILDSLDTNEKSILLAIVNRSLHPVSRALRESILATGFTSTAAVPPGAVEEIAGRGVILSIDGDQWKLGKAAWAAPGISPQSPQTVLSRNGAIVACFEFIERPREELALTLEKLKAFALENSLLSGDNSEKVALLNQTLGHPFQPAIGELSPQDKKSWVENHQPESILMIGDGLNDRLAFDAAHCKGSPVVEQGALRPAADFLFSGFSLGSLPSLFRQAKRYRQVFSTVLAFAIGYNFTAIILCFAGWMNPLLAAVLMPLSSLFSLALASRTPLPH